MTSTSGVLPQPMETTTAWAPYAWQRWMRRWPWFFYALLALAVVSWWTGEKRATPPVTGILLVVALVVWERVWARVIVHPRWAATRWTLPLLAAAALAASMLLTHQNFSFWLVGLTLLPLYYVVLPLPWAVLGSAALTAHAGWEVRAAGGAAPLPPAQLAGFLLSRTVLVTVLGLFLRSVVRQAERRHRLTDELAATRKDLATAERVAGTLEERQRIARELHDTLAQDLSAIVVHLETAEQLLPEAAADVREQVLRARAVARGGLEETRRIVLALRPEVLEQVELPEAVARVARQWAERSGIPTASAITGVPTALHPEAEITLLRALQESLANVRKHASARRVAVTLSYMEDLMVLDVRDDGVGFTPDERAPGPATRAGGLGLRGMRERVEQLGGIVTIESEPGEGTTVTVSLPLLHTAEHAVIRPEGA